MKGEDLVFILAGAPSEGNCQLLLGVARQIVCFLWLVLVTLQG